MPALLELTDVRKTFGSVRKKPVVAVDGVNLVVEPGEALGLIGESGSGKSTLARLAIGLLRPDSGTVLFDGSDLAGARGAGLRDLRRSMHMIFQDPYDSLSPRLTVGDVVAEPMMIHGVPKAERPARMLGALTEADLTPASEIAQRYPHELSGGQRQRVALARALVLRPKLIIADEPTSMLDVSLRAGLLATMNGLRASHGIAILLITHDLAVATMFCDRLAVMFRGRIVELASSASIVADPRHPYTRALLAAVTHLAAPEVPAPSDHTIAAGGCGYRDRCPLAFDACAVAPHLIPASNADPTRPHVVACHADNQKGPAH